MKTKDKDLTLNEKKSSQDNYSKPSDEPTSKRPCSNPENICLNEKDALDKPSDSSIQTDSGAQDKSRENDVSSQKNHAFDAKNFLESYWYALSGLKLIVTNERNFRIQLVTTISVVVMGLFFRINHDDWVLLFVVTGIVLIAESFNSVIEAVCDTVSQEYRVNIRYAKNVSAGAVLVGAMISFVTGVIIFAPYVMEFLSEFLPI
jgi:diacylglycerol kinase